MGGRWWGRISWGCRGGTGGSDQVLLGDGSRLQSGTAQRSVGLGNAVVVGADSTNRGRQILLSGGRCGGQGHHLGLASELGVLLEKNLICGEEISNLQIKTNKSKSAHFLFQISSFMSNILP